MAARILTLTTDFGISDPFVGIMKGVILGICPAARIVDISHDVTPFEIPEAAFLIFQAYRYFPPRTIHVVVVDPGVGTARRPILIEAAGQYFLAPDNGVLTMICAREKHKVRLILSDRYFLQAVSHTFHGRDIFAPVAAHLAAGVAPARFGKLITDHLVQDFHKPLRTGKRTWMGRILRIDRFGNLITNFHTADFPDLAQRTFDLAIGPHHIGAMARTYAEAALGQLCLIVGSSGYLEISANQSSAAQAIGCETGAPAELSVW
jgi:S-adenosylmethionine hydrolase